MKKPHELRRQRLTPTQQFSLLLLLVLLVGGAGLAATATWLVQRTVLGQTWFETLAGVEGHFRGVFGTDIFVQAAPTPAGHNHDGAAGQSDQPGVMPAPAIDMARFDRIVRFHLAVYDIAHARFVRADGRIVYSYQPAEIGRSVTDLAPPTPLARALAGEPVTESGHLPSPVAPDGQDHPEVISFFIPVVRDGQVVGAAWVQRDVTRLMGAIHRAQALLVGATAGVVGLLFIALRRVYRDSTRQIRAQASALDHAYGELSATYSATLQALTTALDSRDHETGGHAQRVTRLAVRLGEMLGLTANALADLELGAVLHDIGKIGVPDAILRKPGPLTDDEWAIMRQHPVFGAEMLAAVPFLRKALPLVRHHHERWDGRGYPDGLAGATIPLGARIFAVADALDAMTSRRPYRPPLGLAQARAELARCAGSQFDPVVVAALAGLDDRELLALLEAPAGRMPRRAERVA